MVSFEIARRHRFRYELNTLRECVDLAVLPTGKTPGNFNDPTELRYNYSKAIRKTIDVASTVVLAG